MPSDNSQFDRRSVLKTSGVALSGLFGVSGVAAANPGHGNGRKEENHESSGPPEHAGPTERADPPEHAGPPKWAQVQNNRLKMAVSRPEWNAAAAKATDAPGIPDGAKSVPYEAIQQASKELNAMIDAGEAELQSQGAEIEFNISSKDGEDKQ